MKKLLWLGLALLAVLAGCDMFSRDFTRDPGDIVDPTKGSVVLLFDGSALPTKTIVPNGFSMNISSYKLTFTKPNASTYEEIITGAVFSKTYSGMETGNWSVRVHAYNTADPANGTMIGSITGAELGNMPFTITAGGVEVVPIEVVPMVGNGTLSLSLAWTDAAIENEELEATLKAVSIAPAVTPGIYGDFSDIAVDTGDTTKKKTTYSNSTLANGYYPLVLRLYGSDPNRTLVWGWVEAVRIIYNQNTSQSWVLTSGLSGQFTLNTTSNMQNPIDITLTPTATTFAASAGLTVTATSVIGASYAWYLDGSVLTIGSDGVTAPTVNQIAFAGNPTPSAKLTVGNHNLSVLVTSTGGVISSNTIAFTVTP